MKQDDMERVQVAVTSEELGTIEEYRKRKNTSVLVIMFTDIKGFTRITEEKGENYSGELRRFHDTILMDTIQRDDAGIVIKFVGDAVMAVFSEPASAVEKALEIEERIRELNESHAEYEDIEVRIGLHMGQVAVENNVQMDIFGRHVNRASRVEAAADGGQIFLTYSVFDSARGWLADRNEFAWENHGKYLLKGINTPVDIYEVYDKRFRKPKPPQNLKKKRQIPSYFYLLLSVLIGVAITMGVLQIRKTSVLFVSLPRDSVYLDRETMIYLEDVEGGDFKKPKEDLSPGNHTIHYDVSKKSRYYAQFEVKRGKNIIKPVFKETFLPGLQINAYYRDENSRSITRTKTYAYTIIDEENRQLEKQATIDAQAEVMLDQENPGQAVFSLRWSVLLDGQEIGSGDITDRNSISGSSRKYFKPVIIYEDETHFYFYEYVLIRDAVQFRVDSWFTEYKTAP